MRADDSGKVVVTKGDQYNVREGEAKQTITDKVKETTKPTDKDKEKEKGAVRDLGDPVELAKRYYEEGADEITVLNITGFRSSPLTDAPMIKVLLVCVSACVNVWLWCRC